MKSSSPLLSLVALALLLPLAPARAQWTVSVTPTTTFQEIDGFGTCISSSEGTQAWWQRLYLDDLGANILRIDLVPRFKSPWSDNNYNSPWFRGRGNQPFAFNFEIDASHNPRYYTGPAGKEFVTVGGRTYYNGPEGNRARTYSDADSYTRLFGNVKAPIAVMGPNINDNVSRYFNLNDSHTETAEAIIDAARSRDPSLATFKLVGSLWSPAPWLKVSSGNVTGPAYGTWPNGDVGTPLPYIALSGNFVGGRLDTSEAPIALFDDSALPDAPTGDPNATAPRGPTSALTQFARCTAAYLRALQNKFGTRFYAISIQNELNFETFYNSCTYPLSEQYIKALKAVRTELDKYDDLRGILIKGPEDLLTDASFGLWQFGGGSSAVHKNLQYLRNIDADPDAKAAIAFFCIHGYGSDGVSAAGADPIAWDRWANGWSTSPGQGIPPNVKGFVDFSKKSWMTETSGESPAWLHPSNGFPNNGAWSIALKIHQALTVGQQSAWIYWQMTDGNDIAESTLTDDSSGAAAGKFTAMRHFSRYITPGSFRVQTSATRPAGGAELLVSAYFHQASQRLTFVLINQGNGSGTATLNIPSTLSLTGFDARTSRSGSLWESSQIPVLSRRAAVPVPGFGVVTLTAVVGQVGPPPINGDPVPLGDLDNDGDPDLALASKFAVVRVPGPQFTPPNPVAGVVPIRKQTLINIRDLNGDGLSDFAAASRGSLSLLLSPNYQRSGTPFALPSPKHQPVASADMNNDGFVDVLIQSRAELSLLTNDGAGAFKPSTFPVLLPTARYKVVGVTADSDGRNLAVLVQYRRRLSKITGANFTQVQPFPLSTKGNQKVVAINPLNPTGNLEVIVQRGKTLEILGTPISGQVPKKHRCIGPR